MSRFKKCAKVAHAKLHSFFPQISLGQTQQLLAAALGHKTYSSFSISDAAAFDGQAAYAVLVPESARLRALDFGIKMNQEHWDLLISEISEKQVVGDLEICQHLNNIYWRARYEFFDGQYQEIKALVRPHGTVEVFRRLLSEAPHIEPAYVDDGGALPQDFYVTLHGEICVAIDSSRDAGWGVPVHAEFGFKRIGRRLLTQSELTSIRQVDSPRQCAPYDERDSDGGMTFN
jgi:hypothetical protein